MINNSNTLSYIIEYAKQLRVRIDQLESKLNMMPNGKLTYKRKSNNVQYYYCSDESKKIHYLSKKKDSQITKLANKYYIYKVLPQLRKNLHAAEKFIALHSGTEEAVLFEAMPTDLQLRNKDLFISKSNSIEEWQKRQYIRNPYKPENLLHDTIRGEKVRSKSEVIIANSLFRSKLAYFVESPLKLKISKRTIYPDFTILNPCTLEEQYWEHFGMMDNPEYAAEAVKRIHLLDNEGIIIGKNLICTFETSGAPLSSALVESYIREYFLTNS